MDDFDNIDIGGGFNAGTGGNDFSSFDTEFGNQGGGIDSLMNAIDANSAANFNLDDFMTELGGMGTDLGPSSNMGMDYDMLQSLGLENLGNDDWQNYAFYEAGDKTTQDAFDRAEALKGDNIDAGGGYNPATGKGDAATAEAFRQTGVTGSASTPHLTTPSGITPGPTKITPGGGTPTPSLVDKLKTALTGGTKADGTKSGMNPMTMMMLMMLLSQMGKGGGGGSSAASLIPKLSANRSQLPYSPPSRPGAGGKTYFSPTTYSQQAAGGGLMGYAGGGGISSLGSYSDGGRLLKGPGDGVSDNIPATIAGKQPARLANGEFVVPARIVSELGNGSTDAGAKRLYEMMDRVQKARRKTKNVAADTKAHKYLPA